MKIQKYDFNIKRVVFLIGIFILLFSCQLNTGDSSDGSSGGSSGGSNSGGDTEVSILAPTNAVAKVDGDNIIISWDAVSGAVNYQIYREVDGAVTVLIDDAYVSTMYIDTNFPKNQSLRYIITASSAKCTSDPSCTNDISMYVLDIETTKLEFTNKTVVSWSKHDSAIKYNVYRYESNNSTPVLISSGYTGTVFEDTTVSQDTSYFYQITWIDSLNIEHGLNSSLYLGIRGSQVDPHEPNDILDDYSGPLDYDIVYDAMLYSFANKDDEVYADTDFYYFEYPDDPEGLTVHVNLPVNTNFNNGELKFRFYNGSYSQEYNIYKGDNSFFYDDYSSEDAGVYFKIYTDIDSSRSVIGSYQFEIKQGFN